MSGRAGTLVCVPIMIEDVESALADAGRAHRLGADLVEFRLDRFFAGDQWQGEACADLVARSPIPCIATCRPTWEGGEYDGDEQERISLFERLGTSDRPPAYIDVELAAYTRSANIRQKVNLSVRHPGQLRDGRPGLILSLHDFQGRPSDLSRRVALAREQQAASVIKVAYRARSLRDNLELFDLVRYADRPMIALGMGEFGLMSRVLAPKFGAFLTFASLRDSGATAPGQPTIEELLGHYRFREIARDTLVYGVMGWPVAQSLSPRLHNAAFSELGMDAVYLPLPVAASADDEKATRASFTATMDALRAHAGLGFAGASVTIPFKEQLAQFAESEGPDVSVPVRGSGAANTIDVRRGAVANTDLLAIHALLTAEYEGLNGKRVAVFGAGGAARAAAYACAAMGGASVHVFNRTDARAQELAAEMNAALQDPDITIAAKALSRIGDDRYDAVINCTPVGMAHGPDPDGVAIPLDQLKTPERTIVFDTVYNPVETPLIRASRERGLRVIDGLRMFTLQAAFQMQFWASGAPGGPHLELYERIARTHL